MLCTRENSDVFNTLDKIYLVFISKSKFLLFYLRRVEKNNEDSSDNSDFYHVLYDFTLGLYGLVQHALPPHVDSKINHSSFSQNSINNKGIEFINLPSIIKDKSGFTSITT